MCHRKKPLPYSIPVECCFFDTAIDQKISGNHSLFNRLVWTSWDRSNSNYQSIAPIITISKTVTACISQVRNNCNKKDVVGAEIFPFCPYAD